MNLILNLKRNLAYLFFKLTIFANICEFLHAVKKYEFYSHQMRIIPKRLTIKDFWPLIINHEP